MPLSTPVFADVATRLRHGPISACDVASTAPRLPSTRSLDRRWDQSRGIVLTNAKRKTHLNRSGVRDRTAAFQLTPSSNSAYATKPIGAQTPPAATSATQKPKISKPSSYVDSAHKITGFSGASLKQSEELKAKLDEITKENDAKQKEIARLRDDAKGKDDAIRKHARDVADSLRKIDNIKATLVKETEKLQQTIKQEKDTRKLSNAATKRAEGLERDIQALSSELLAARRAAVEAHQAHQNELQALRDSAADAIADNAPILEAARVEGEKRAQQALDKQLQELKQIHAADLKTRLQNERLQKSGEEALLRSQHRDELAAERAESRAFKAERDAQILQAQRVAAQKSDLQKRLDGRQARGRKDRVDYQGYRELFHVISDSVNDILEGSTSVRNALKKETDLWRKSLTQFQNSKELFFFRQNPRYNDLKRSINSFLERRKQEAEVALEENRAHSWELYDAREALNLQGHATRMVTRHLHFDSNSTEANGVDVSHYMSLVLPWVERKNECDKREDELRQVEKQRGISAVSDDLERLRGHRGLILEHLKHGDAVRRREMFKALLNSSVEDRVTYVRVQEFVDRISYIRTRLPNTSSFRNEHMKAKRYAEQVEGFVRKRLIVQQDLGQLDEQTIKTADDVIRKRISIATREEELAMDVILGKRTSSAKTMKERRVEQLRAASTAQKASLSVDQLAATLAADSKSPKAVIRISPRPLQHPQTTGRVRLKERIKLYQRSIARLRAYRRQTKATGVGNALMLQQIKDLREKLGKAEAEFSMMPPKGAVQAQARDSSASKQEPAIDIAATVTASGLNFQPSQPMQACHVRRPQGLSKRQVQISQWHTLSDALGPGSQSSGQSLTASTICSALTSPRPPTVHKMGDQSNEAGSVALPVTAFPAGQSPDKSASPLGASHTHAPGSQSTSAESIPAVDGMYAPTMSTSAVSGEDGVHVSFEASPPSSMSSYVPSDDGSYEGADSPQPAEDTEWKQEPHTLLDYQIPQKAYREAVMASPTSNAAYWSHQLYKTLDGKSPTVYYCKTLETAERQCKLFFDEPVLGFDLEWEPGASAGKSPIKKAVSLIQLAAEDKICLIHVACFAGESIEQLLPPSLKTLLEDSNVAKAGVNIGGDATRMRQCFEVDMKGVFELSHMYRLVKMPEAVSFKLVSLATQVQNTLLLPLKKDEVRTSAWSKSLNMQQCAYAAADAYAGFRLFYQLDNLRKDMKPAPPRPAFAETLGPIILGDGTVIERAAIRAKSGAKKAAVPDQQAESDDEFFDALEDIPDTFGSEDAVAHGSRGLSAPKSIKDGAIDIDEVDPDSVNALSDMVAHASLDDLPPAKTAQDVRTSASGTNRPLDAKWTTVAHSAKPVRQAPHVLVASPETILADMWVASLPSRNPKVGAASLRAYHLWHHQNHSLDAVAGICRQPPLAMTSVASYIMTAIKEEDMPYEKERLREAFQHLPKSVWHVYGKWVKELGLDK